jgi:hypothetical protein
MLLNETFCLPHAPTPSRTIPPTQRNTDLLADLRTRKATTTTSIVGWLCMMTFIYDFANYIFRKAHDFQTKILTAGCFYICSLTFFFYVNASWWTHTCTYVCIYIHIYIYIYIYMYTHTNVPLKHTNGTSFVCWLSVCASQDARAQFARENRVPSHEWATQGLLRRSASSRCQLSKVQSEQVSPAPSLFYPSKRILQWTQAMVLGFGTLNFLFCKLSFQKWLFALTFSFYQTKR